MDEIKGDNNAGVRLKSLRDEMRASQRAFGAPLGFNQAAVSAFEQGKVVFRKSNALAVEYVYGIRHEWLLFGMEPKVRESEIITEDEKELLRIHRAIDYRDRPTWLKLGRLLAADMWDGKSERRQRDRRRSERRAADRNPPECAALPRDRGANSKDTPAA